MQFKQKEKEQLRAIRILRWNSKYMGTILSNSELSIVLWTYTMRPWPVA